MQLQSGSICIENDESYLFTRCDISWCSQFVMELVTIFPFLLQLLLLNVTQRHLHFVIINATKSLG